MPGIRTFPTWESLLAQLCREEKLLVPQVLCKNQQSRGTCHDLSRHHLGAGAGWVDGQAPCRGEPRGGDELSPGLRRTAEGPTRGSAQGAKERLGDRGCSGQGTSSCSGDGGDMLVPPPRCSGGLRPRAGSLLTWTLPGAGPGPNSTCAACPSSSAPGQRCQPGPPEFPKCPQDRHNTQRQAELVPRSLNRGANHTAQNCQWHSLCLRARPWGPRLLTCAECPLFWVPGRGGGTVPASWGCKRGRGGGDQQVTKTQIHRGEHLAVHLGAGGWEGLRGRGRNGEGRGRGGSTTDPGVSMGWTRDLSSLSFFTHSHSRTCVYTHPAHRKV